MKKWKGKGRSDRCRRGGGLLGIETHLQNISNISNVDNLAELNVNRITRTCPSSTPTPSTIQPPAAARPTEGPVFALANIGS